MGASISGQYNVPFKEIFLLYSHKPGEKLLIKGFGIDSKGSSFVECIAEETLLRNGSLGVQSQQSQESSQVFIGKFKFTPPQSNWIKSLHLECLVKAQMLFSTDSKYQAQTEYTLDGISSKPSIFLFHVSFKETLSYAFARKPPGSPIKPFFEQLTLFFGFLVESNQINLLDSLFASATAFSSQMNALVLGAKELVNTLSFCLKLCASSSSNPLSSAVGLLSFLGYLVRRLTVKQTLEVNAEFFSGFSDHVLERVLSAQFAGELREMLEQRDFPLRQTLFEGIAALVVWNLQWESTKWLAVLEFLSFNDLVSTIQAFLITSNLKVLSKEYYARLIQGPLKAGHLVTIVHSCGKNPTRSLLCFDQLIEANGGVYRLPFEFYSQLFCSFWESVNISKFPKKNQEKLVGFFEKHPQVLKAYAALPSRLKKFLENSCHFATGFLKLVHLIVHDEEEGAPARELVLEVFKKFLRSHLEKENKDFPFLEFLETLESCHAISRDSGAQEVIAEYSAKFIAREPCHSRDQTIEKIADSVIPRLHFLQNDRFVFFLLKFLEEKSVDFSLKTSFFVYVCKEHMENRDQTSIMELFNVILTIQSQIESLGEKERIKNAKFIMENEGVSESHWAFFSKIFIEWSWKNCPEVIFEVFAGPTREGNFKIHKRVFWEFVQQQSHLSFFKRVLNNVQRISLESLTQFLQVVGDAIETHLKEVESPEEQKEEEKEGTELSGNTEDSGQFEAFLFLFACIFEAYLKGLPSKESLFLLEITMSLTKLLSIRKTKRTLPKAILDILLMQKASLNEILRTKQVFWEVEGKLKSLLDVSSFYNSLLELLAELELISSDELSELALLLSTYGESFGLYFNLLEEFSHLRNERAVDKKVHEQLDTLRYETLPKWNEFILRDSCFMESLVTAFQDNTFLHGHNDKLLLQLASESDRGFELDERVKQLERESKASGRKIEEMSQRLAEYERRDKEYMKEITKGLKKSEEAEQLLQDLKRDLVKRQKEIETYQTILGENEAEFKTLKERIEKALNESNQLKEDASQKEKKILEVIEENGKLKENISVFLGEIHSIQKLKIEELENIEKVLSASIKNIQLVKATKEAAMRCEAPKCKVCLTNDINVVLKPCNHIVLCTECMKMILRMSKKCPICRMDISKAEKAFFG